MLLRPENLELPDSGIPATVGAARYVGVGYDTALRLASCAPGSLLRPVGLATPFDDAMTVFSGNGGVIAASSA